MKVKRRQANLDFFVQISGRVLNLEITVRRYDRNNDTDTEIVVDLFLYQCHYFNTNDELET